jgi:hypothetical protein
VVACDLAAAAADEAACAIDRVYTEAYRLAASLTPPVPGETSRQNLEWMFAAREGFGG